MPYNADGLPLSLNRDVLEYQEEQKRKISYFDKKKSTHSVASPVAELTKRDFIGPNIDKEKVSNNRLAKWDKVSK